MNDLKVDSAYYYETGETLYLVTQRCDTGDFVGKLVEHGRLREYADALAFARVKANQLGVKVIDNT